MFIDLYSFVVYNLIVDIVYRGLKCIISGLCRMAAFPYGRSSFSSLIINYRFPTVLSRYASQAHRRQ